MESDPLLSRTIDNYEIKERLGRGGMSTVYRAHQTTMERDVAIKVMSAELVEDPQFIARFEREARVIASLEHPRILPVHDYGHEGDVFYMVMRLVEGESLRDRLMRGPISLVMCANLTAQVADALDYAHAKGIIHRDLKPNNVLLDEMDNIYLMDFGIAKLMATTQQLTQSGMVMGTPAYMAPEQWRGEPVDTRTDVYALGVMLFEMITGVQPFETADTPFTLMYKHLNDLPPSIRNTNPEVPEAVEQVIRTALAKLPDDRFQSASALAQALQAAVDSANPDVVSVPLVFEKPEGVPAPGTNSAEHQAAHSNPDELAAIPLPDQIVPPDDPGRPPIPVPPKNGRSGFGEAPIQGVPDSFDGPRKAKMKHGAPASEQDGDTPLPFELPGNTPPAVRGVLEWTADRLQYVSIPGFVEPTIEPEPSSVAKRGTTSDADSPSGEWIAVLHSEAMEVVDYYLGDDEQLTGVIYARGTDNWRFWRRMLIAGVAISIFGSIFGGLFDLWILNFASTIVWLAVIIEGFRIWRGKKGHLYIGFTDLRVVVLPITESGRPIPANMTSALWNQVYRCRRTDETIWIEADGSDTVYALGWIPKRGIGGLGRQRRWLLRSPIADTIRTRGFYAKQ